MFLECVSFSTARARDFEPDAGVLAAIDVGASDSSAWRPCPGIQLGAEVTHHGLLS